jgi:hypothetical protein
MKRFIAVTTCIIALACIASTSVAHAANETGQALEIAPPVTNLTADAGDVKTININLRDISSNALVVTGEVNDFTAAGEDGTPKLTLDANETSPYSIKTWIDTLQQLTLQPREVKTLPVTVRVPKNAAPGGYYGVIRFTATAPGVTGNGVSLSASLGALIFIRVSGDAKESVNFAEFYTTDKSGNKNWLFESQPVTFVARIQNAGNVHEQPTGQITVKDMFGNAVASVNMNLERRNVLPSSIRKFEADMDKTNVGNRFLFGYYTANIVMTYGANNQTVTSTVGFWIIPWRLVLTVLGALIVVVIVIRFLVKRYTDRVVGRSRGSRRR